MNADKRGVGDVKTEERIIERLLQSIVEEDIEIVTVIVDKRVILRPPKDPEDIYREAVTRAVAHASTRFSKTGSWSKR